MSTTSPGKLLLRRASAREERVKSVFLRDVVDKPLSARFWARLGFRPHIHTDGLWI